MTEPNAECCCGKKWRRSTPADGAPWRCPLCGGPEYGEACDFCRAHGRPVSTRPQTGEVKA